MLVAAWLGAGCAGVSEAQYASKAREARLYRERFEEEKERADKAEAELRDQRAKKPVPAFADPGAGATGGGADAAGGGAEAANEALETDVACGLGTALGFGVPAVTFGVVSATGGSDGQIMQNIALGFGAVAVAGLVYAGISAMF
jgi:hypothetical protein